MKRPILLVSAFLLAAPHGFTQTLSLKVAGVSRSATLHVPTGSLTSPPLVFLLHGLGGTAPAW